MATTTHEHFGSAFGPGQRFFAGLSAGTGTEAIGGAAAVVLAIIGLADIEPFYMAAISTLAVGAALFIEGAVVMAKHAEMLATFEAERGGPAEATTAGGVTVELLGGAAGVVMGILALVNVVPWTLLAVAALVFGATLLLGAGMTSRIKNFEIDPSTQYPGLRQVVHEVAIASSGAQALVALAAVVLGILALVNIAPHTLILVSLLVLGGSILLSGSALTTQILTGMGRHVSTHTS